MPSADIQALVSAAILLLLGIAIVLLSTRRSSMKPAARWAPWLALLAGPVIVNFAWVLQFVLLDRGSHPHAVADALALLPSVQVIGTLASTPAACVVSFVVRRRSQLEERMNADASSQSSSIRS